MDNTATYTAKQVIFNLGHSTPHSSASGCLDELQRWIELQTQGRLHRLSLERVGDKLIIHGCADAYYTVQLAVTALSEALDSFQCDPVPELQLDVHVLPGAMLRRAG